MGRASPQPTSVPLPSLDDPWPSPPPSLPPSPSPSLSTPPSPPPPQNKFGARPDDIPVAPPTPVRIAPGAASVDALAASRRVAAAPGGGSPLGISFSGITAVDQPARACLSCTLEAGRLPPALHASLPAHPQPPAQPPCRSAASARPTRPCVPARAWSWRATTRCGARSPRPTARPCRAPSRSPTFLGCRVTSATPTVSQGGREGGVRVAARQDWAAGGSHTNLNPNPNPLLDQAYSTTPTPGAGLSPSSPLERRGPTSSAASSWRSPRRPTPPTASTAPLCFATTAWTTRERPCRGWRRGGVVGGWRGGGLGRFVWWAASREEGVPGGAAPAARAQSPNHPPQACGAHSDPESGSAFAPGCLGDYPAVGIDGNSLWCGRGGGWGVGRAAAP